MRTDNFGKLLQCKECGMVLYSNPWVFSLAYRISFMVIHLRPCDMGAWGGSCRDSHGRPPSCTVHVTEREFSAALQPSTSAWSEFPRRSCLPAQQKIFPYEQQRDLFAFQPDIPNTVLILLQTRLEIRGQAATDWLKIQSHVFFSNIDPSANGTRTLKAHKIYQFDPILSKITIFFNFSWICASRFTLLNSHFRIKVCECIQQNYLLIQHPTAESAKCFPWYEHHKKNRSHSSL